MAAAARKPIIAEQSPADALAQAQAAVDNLNRCRDEAQRRVEMIDEALKPLAFAASQGDADAIAKRDELRRQRVEAQNEIGDCTAALAEAEARVASAKADIEADAATQRAAEFAQLCAAFIKESE